MSLIRRNSKQLPEIFANAKNGAVHGLDNYFIGKSCSIEWIKKEFEDFNFAKMTKEGKSYTVHIHNNEWYHFESI